MRTHFVCTLILLFAGALSAQVTKVDPLKLVKPSATASRFYGTNSSGATAWLQLSDIVSGGSGVSVSGNTIGLTGVPTGSGAAGQLAFWSATAVLTGSSDAQYASSVLTLNKSYTNTSDMNLVLSGTINGLNWRTSTSRFTLTVGYQNGTTMSLLYGAGTSNPSTELMRWTSGEVEALVNLKTSTFTLTGTTLIAGSPSSALDNYHLNSGGNNRLRISSPNGRVGFVFNPSLIASDTRAWSFETGWFQPGSLTLLRGADNTVTSPATAVLDFDRDGTISVNSSSHPAQVFIQGTASTAGSYALIVTNATGTTSTAALCVQNNNTVGFGTNAPTAAADINGTIRIRPFSTANNLLSVSDANGNITSVTPATVVTNGLGFRQGGNTFGAIGVAGTNDAFSMSLIAGGKEFLLGTTGGNVSIGSNATPSQRVSIFGPPSTVGTPFNDALVSIAGTWHNGTSSLNRTVEFGVDMLAATPTSEWVMKWSGGNPFLKALYTNQLVLPDYTSATAYTGTPVANLSVTSAGNVITTAPVDGRFAVNREVATFSTTVPSATGVNNAGWWVVPASLNGYKITGVGYSVATAGSGSGSYAIQINRLTTGGSSTNFASATFVAADKQKDVTGLSFTLATGDLIRINIGTADLATLPQGLTINYTIAP